MKNIGVALLVVATIALGCKTSVKGKNGVDYSSAVQYNDYIVGRQSDVLKMMDQFTTTAKNGTLEETNSFLDQTASKVDKMVTEIEGMPDWKGNTELRDKSVTLFKYYKKLFASTYKRNIAIQADGQVTPEEEVEQKLLEKEMVEAGQPLEDEMIRAQKDFASKVGIQLEKK